MCFRKSAKVQICWSESSSFRAGMPVQRMPCFLRRAWILALSYGRRGRVSFCCAVAKRAVCFVELDAVDEILVSQLHRIRLFRSILVEGRLERSPGNESLDLSRLCIGICRYKAAAQGIVAHRCSSQDSENNREYEASEHLRADFI
jgi:hypothetical protein